MMTFESLGLSSEIVRATTEKGYIDPTPVQQQVIPSILQGKDLMAGAQTGTGKTAGFTLPMLHRLSLEAQPGGQRVIRALILAPSRELAAQVWESVTAYGKYLPLRSTVVYGGVNIGQQMRKLRSGIDILVATPGRLLDLHRQRCLDLSKVETFVLDEADRMLDMGFIHDIREIIALLPKKRQNLMFSATSSNEIKKLADSILVTPEKIQVATLNSISDKVTQIIHPVNQKQKRELLSFMIGSENMKQVLVFTRTKHSADRLTSQLIEDGIQATSIHSDKNQGARTRALAAFKRGQVQVLVATDIASRGLDISQLSTVINYELPFAPEDYLHRIGRTGRAGNEGRAISLVGPDEIKLLKNIERLLKITIPRVKLEGYEPSPEAERQISLDDFTKVVRGGGSRAPKRTFGRESSGGERGGYRGGRPGGERSSSDRAPREYRDNPYRGRDGGGRDAQAGGGDRRRRDGDSSSRGAAGAGGGEYRRRDSDSRGGQDGGEYRRREGDSGSRGAAGAGGGEYRRRDGDSGSRGAAGGGEYRRRDSDSRGGQGGGEYRRREGDNGHRSGNGGGGEYRRRDADSNSRGGQGSGEYRRREGDSNGRSSFAGGENRRPSRSRDDAFGGGEKRRTFSRDGAGHGGRSAGRGEGRGEGRAAPRRNDRQQPRSDAAFRPEKRKTLSRDMSKLPA